MTYFKECTTISEVKQLFRELAKQMHPDHGGSNEQMQVLNAAYSFAVAKLAKGENLSQEETNSTILEAEKYQEAINAIINLKGILIEVVGSWIWVTGQTFPVKDTIKAAGFMFASKKVAWYFRTDENKCSNGGKRQSLDEIKGKYGSQVVNGSNYAKRHYIN